MNLQSGQNEREVGCSVTFIIEKNGFRQEGLLRQREQKWGKYEDVVILAILRQDWLAGIEN
ncbi:MAG: GNAT family protein [Bacteroidota bacterium]|nr:GNAT family protein [Bacteroidota bacterium]